jgi:hypothetical protein
LDEPVGVPVLGAFVFYAIVSAVRPLDVRTLSMADLFRLVRGRGDFVLVIEQLI